MRYLVLRWQRKCIEENSGVSQYGVGKTMCMDYSAPNIAKNFQVGHLRTTVIGNSLYKIYQKLGYVSYALEKREKGNGDCAQLIEMKKLL